MVNPIAFGLVSGFAQVHWCRISGEIIEAEDRTGVRLVGGAGNGLYRSFRNFFCDEPPAPAPPGTLEPPFTGGQCLKEYDIFVVFQNQPAAGGPPVQGAGQGRFYGPISNIFLRELGATSYQIVVRHGVAGSPGTTVETVIAGGTFNPGDEVSIVSTSVTPVDGIDNCGNAPPTLPPEGDDYYSDSFNVTVNSGGNSYSFPITITSNPTTPRLNDDGDLSVPITITFPDNDQSIDIDIDIEGDVDVTGGNPPIPSNPNNPPGAGDGNPGTGGGRDDPDEYAPNEPAPDVPPGVEEPPQDPTAATAIRGAIVTCSNAEQVNGVTAIFQSNGLPTVYAPYLGLLQFYITTPEGAGGWTTDIPVKNARQHITCDWFGGASDVRVSPRSNALLTVTPLTYRLDE